MDQIKDIILNMADQVEGLDYAVGESRCEIPSTEALNELNDFLQDLCMRHGYKQKPLRLADYTCDDEEVPF